MSQAEVKFKEGMVHMKNAEKMITTSLFKWKPDWEGGAAEFQQAATCFKNAKAHEQAKEAFLKSSEASYKMGYLISAAQAMENAASMAKQMKRYEEAGEIYKKTSDIYMENGSADKAADILAKAGETLKEVSLEKAGEYYVMACDLYITEGKEQLGQETFKNAISILLKSKKIPEAIEILKKQTQAYQKVDNKTMTFRCILSAIILHLANGDQVEANKQYQLALQYEGFVASDESRVANEIMDAYEQGDQEKLTQAASKQLVGFLEHEIARAARNLKAVGGDGDSGLL